MVFELEVRRVTHRTLAMLTFADNTGRFDSICFIALSNYRVPMMSGVRNSPVFQLEVIRAVIMTKSIFRWSHGSWYAQLILVCSSSLALVGFSGCQWSVRNVRLGDCEPCQEVLQRIEYPDLCDQETTSGDELLTTAPMTISSFQELTPLELSLDEAVQLALANSKVLQKLGGVVVNSPQAATTLYDPALVETAFNGVEQALQQFDAQFSSSLFFNHSEQAFNNLFFGGGAASLKTDAATFNMGLSKQTAYGTSFTLRHQTDYNRNTAPANLFRSTYNMLNQMEFRQPLARGYGAMVNRVAGPNALPGQYNGVLIARIRGDISLADFEAAVRNLVLDVENNYWELYFAYRDLDTKVSARESALKTWENRKLRLESGIGRPDEEAQARQQYLNFEAQAQNALTGLLNGQSGVLGSERNLRRLLGLPVSDGQIIRPITDPATAPVVFDWQQSQQKTLNDRVEMRRQKWTVRQRELELMAAKALNRWRVDLVGQYGFRGFGDNLFGSRSRANGSAFDDLINGDLDDWQLGLEVNGPIGNRSGHVAVRNAELNLTREKTVLKEQQRQLLHDLSAAFTEVDRAFVNMKTQFNSRVAVEQELEPKQKRADAGQDQIFFLLDAQQRAATAESAIHRAIADYNRALANYSFTTGNLLDRFGIVLTEGPWSEAAQNNAVRKAPRYVSRSSGPRENTKLASERVKDNGMNDMLAN